MSTQSDLDLVGEARGLIGREVVRRTGIVRKEAFQRWAVAVKDHNPLYFDPDYARSQGYRDVVMPALFLQDISHPVLPLDELSPDGMPLEGEAYAVLSLPQCPRRMAAGTEMNFYAPLYDGDSVTASAVFESIEQKSGRSGEFVVATWRTTYTRDDGVVVAEEVRSVIARPGT
jgi:acyl dehydratase